MDNFTALPQEIFDFEEFARLDFEEAWKEISCGDSALSDEEKTLFPGIIADQDEDAAAMNSTLMRFEDRNPMLTSSVLDEAPIILTHSEGDLITGDQDLHTSIDLSDILDMPMDYAPEDSALTSPVTAMVKESKGVANTMDQVLEIHSYCQQPPIQTPPKVKRVVAKVAQDNKEEKIHINLDQKPIKRLRKPKRRFDESSEDEEEDSDEEFQTTKSKSTSRGKSIPKKKQKLYEMSPFSDPDMEQKRLNAINARKNRERKRKEKNSMQKSMDILREENERLQKKNDKYKNRLNAFEARLQALETIIGNSPQLLETLKSSGKNGLLSKDFDDGNSTGNSSTEDETEEVIYYNSE